MNWAFNQKRQRFPSPPETDTHTHLVLANHKVFGSVGAQVQTTDKGGQDTGFVQDSQLGCIHCQMGTESNSRFISQAGHDILVRAQCCRVTLLLGWTCLAPE